MTPQKPWLILLGNGREPAGASLESHSWRSSAFTLTRAHIAFDETKPRSGLRPHQRRRFPSRYSSSRFPHVFRGLAPRSHTNALHSKHAYISSKARERG